MTEYNGVINVCKEPGYTSHDVVARLRGITHMRKIGHTGTLDPDAEGVLPVCLGAATKISDMLMEDTKEYRAMMHLGVTTDTQDMSGSVLSEGDVSGIDEDMIREAVMSFVGHIDQIPPMYSAIKVGGRKLYELARAGQEIERTPRPVTIHSIDICEIDIPDATIDVVCSKGTYIRTLIHDIGAKLGCGAAMSHLIRTRTGRFNLQDAHRLDEIEQIVHDGCIGEILIPLTEVFSDLRRVYAVDEGADRASNGNKLRLRDIELSGSQPQNGEEVLVMGSDGFFYGVYEYSASERMLIPVKMFLCK